MLLTIFSFVVVLGILVFIHELGHYWVARRNGIVVEEFGMGYPPRIIKLFRYDGTDFTINLIPFGGFARMKGEDASDMSPGSFNAASKGARAATLVAGPVMNALLAIVLFAASFMAGFPAVVAHPQLTDVPSGSRAAQIGLQSNDILISVDGRPVYVSAIPDFSYDVMPGADEPAGSAAVGMLTISRAGEITQLPIDSGALDAVLTETRHTPVLATVVTGVAEGSPALEAGFQDGDIVHSVNGTAVTFSQPLSDAIRDLLGQEITITVLRGQQWVDLTVTPRVYPPPGQGALGVQIGPMNRLATLPFAASVWQGVVSTGEYVALVLQLPYLLFVGQIAPSDAQLTGPVGIAQLVGGAVGATLETGLWFPILRLSAVLSAALAITNLLPLPALDGGRLLFILFETIRGRRVNPEREGMIHMVGFMLLLGLLVLVTFRDITTTQQGIDWRTLLGQ